MTDTLHDDLLQFRRENGLNIDEDQRALWMAQLGSFIMPLPNFRWRREVINRHDAHHLLTGYPTSVSGELSLAAWELGAECYNDWRAKALCRLLMFFGLVSQPRITLSAFRKGASEAKFYAELQNTEFLNAPLAGSKAELGH